MSKAERSTKLQILAAINEEARKTNLLNEGEELKSIEDYIFKKNFSHEGIKEDLVKYFAINNSGVGKYFLNLNYPELERKKYDELSLSQGDDISGRFYIYDLEKQEGQYFCKVYMDIEEVNGQALEELIQLNGVRILLDGKFFRRNLLDLNLVEDYEFIFTGRIDEYVRQYNESDSKLKKGVQVFTAYVENNHKLESYLGWLLSLVNVLVLDGRIAHVIKKYIGKYIATEKFNPDALTGLLIKELSEY